MRRLCSESSCSYLGRSALHAVFRTESMGSDSIDSLRREFPVPPSLVVETCFCQKRGPPSLGIWLVTLLVLTIAAVLKSKGKTNRG